MTSKTIEKAPGKPDRNPYTAERLFVFGLRCVLNGCDDDYLEQWRDVWNSYSSYFGEETGRPLLDALWQYALAYRRYTKAPTGFHSPDCPCMARDEYLSVALLSSLQYHDAGCSSKCVHDIAHPSGRDELECHAWQLAAEYLSAGQKFFPVSVSDVEATLQTTAALKNAEDSTFH